MRAEPDPPAAGARRAGAAARSGLPAILAGRRRAGFALLVVNGFAQAGVSLAIVLAVRGSTGPASGMGDPTLAAGAILALGLALFALRVLQRRQGDAIALHYVREIRVLLLGRTLSLPPESGRARIGLMMTRLVTDLSAIKNWVANGLASAFVAAAAVPAILAGATLLVPDAAPALLAGFCAWGAVVLASSPFLSRAIRRGRRRRGRMAGELGDIVLSRSTLAHFGRSGPTLRRVERLSTRMNEALVARASWSGSARAASDLVLPLVVGALVGLPLLGGLPASPETLGLALLLAGLVVAQLADLGRAVDLRLAFREAARRLNQILDAGKADEGGGQSLPRAPGGRRARIEVRLAGRGSVAIEAGPGEIVAVSAIEPALERALLAAVAGLRPAPAVTIHLDGIDLDAVGLRDRRRAVTAVSPALPLVRASLAENVALGAPSGVGDEEVERVAGLCGIGAALLGEAGEIDPARVDPALSARARAARALLRRAALVVIDDPDLSEYPERLDTFLAEAGVQRAVVLLAASGGGAGYADAILDLGEARDLDAGPRSEARADDPDAD